MTTGLGTEYYHVVIFWSTNHECEWNWEHMPPPFIVFNINVDRSVGQVDKIEFDEMDQHHHILQQT